MSSVFFKTWSYFRKTLKIKAFNCRKFCLFLYSELVLSLAVEFCTFCCHTAMTQLLIVFLSSSAGVVEDVIIRSFTAPPVIMFLGIQDYLGSVVVKLLRIIYIIRSSLTVLLSGFLGSLNFEKELFYNRYLLYYCRIFSFTLNKFTPFATFTPGMPVSFAPHLIHSPDLLSLETTSLFS